MEINSVDCPKCGGSIPEQISKGKLFKCNNCGSTLVWPDNQSKLLLSFGIRICPNCGVDNDQNHNFCKSCGTKLTKSCPSCKSIFYVGDNFCPNGHSFEHEEQIMEEQKYSHTFSLSYLLGKNIRDREIQTFISNLGVSPEIIGEEGYQIYYSFKSKGIDLNFGPRNELRSIICSSEGTLGGYRQFQGDLPYGLSFLSTRREIESILGCPDVDYGDAKYTDWCWVSYSSKGITIFYNKPRANDLDALIYTISFSQKQDNKSSLG